MHKDDSLRAVRDFLLNNHKAMINYIDSLSSKGPEVSVPIPSPLSTDERYARKRIASVLAQRGKNALILHREAIPLLPHMIDLPRHLAAEANPILDR